MAGMTTQLNLAADRAGHLPRREHPVQRHAASRPRSSTSSRCRRQPIATWLGARARLGASARRRRLRPCSSGARCCRSRRSSLPLPPDLFQQRARTDRRSRRPMTQGIWPAVLGRFDWQALPVRARVGEPDDQRDHRRRRGVDRGRRRDRAVVPDHATSASGDICGASGSPASTTRRSASCMSCSPS